MDMLTDFSGLEIKIGDGLLDERGRVYQVSDIQKTVAAYGVVGVYEMRRQRPSRIDRGSRAWKPLKVPAHIRVNFCLSVNLDELDESYTVERLKKIWLGRAANARVGHRAELLARKRRTDELLRKAGIRK